MGIIHFSRGESACFVHSSSALKSKQASSVTLDGFCAVNEREERERRREESLTGRCLCVLLRVSSRVKGTDFGTDDLCVWCGRPQANC